MKSKDGIKKALKLAGVYVLCYGISSICFVLLFHTALLAEIHVLMYRGIVFILLSGVLAVLIMCIIKHFGKIPIEKKDVLLLFCMYCSVNMVLFTLIPVTVERSVSVFTLSYMMENPKSYTVEEMEKIFNTKYVHEFGAFDKRFEEQIVSGNVEKTEDGYVINEQGIATVKFFRFVSKLFGTDERLIYPNENGEMIDSAQQEGEHDEVR